MKILVLGITGMLGNTVFKVLSQSPEHQVIGTLRDKKMLEHFDLQQVGEIITGLDVLDAEALSETIHTIQPQVVINCIGVIKQLDNAKDPLAVLPLNSLFPHQLAKLCKSINAKLIHISTDCVFNGRKGMYKEEDVSDAEDLYGKSKYIGELHDLPHAVTLRTSIIGHELNSQDSLVDWFLSQQNTVKGYKKAIFSGLPTIELAHVIEKFVLPRPEMTGLYHVSVDPIDKYSLLTLIATVYGKEIDIVADEAVIIDRSLNSDKFKATTGYQPPNWRALVETMYQNQEGMK